MKAKIFLIGICTLCLMACKDKSAPVDQNVPSVIVQKETPKPMSVTLDSLIKKGGGPCLTGTDCMEIEVRWPVVHGGDEKIRKILNDSIYQFVIQNLEYFPEHGKLKIEQVVDSMLATYAADYKENESHGTGWAVEVNGGMDFHDELAVLELSNYSYMGGAHPNSYSQYTNFNTRTGEIIEFSDFVTDTTAFKTIIENKFLADANEKTGKIFLSMIFSGEMVFSYQPTSNWVEKNLEVLYNPYEAAAYVFGEFALEIPYEELKGIIDLDLLKK